MSPYESVSVWSFEEKMFSFINFPTQVSVCTSASLGMLHILPSLPLTPLLKIILLNILTTWHSSELGGRVEWVAGSISLSSVANRLCPGGRL